MRKRETTIEIDPGFTNWKPGVNAVASPDLCPFCAGFKFELLSVSGNIDKFAVHCLRCGAIGPDKEHASQAVHAWNLAKR
jgi:hypothetical protein